MAATAYFIYAAKSGNSVFAAPRPAQKRREQAETPVEAATRNTNGAYDLNYAGTAYAQPAAPAFRSEPQPYAAAQTEIPAADAYPQSPVDQSKRLFAVGETFDFKTKREINKENKRAEAQRPRTAARGGTRFALRAEPLYFISAKRRADRVELYKQSDLRFQFVFQQPQPRLGFARTVFQQLQRRFLVFRGARAQHAHGKYRDRRAHIFLRKSL